MTELNRLPVELGMGVDENFLDQYDHQTQIKLLDFSSEIAESVWAITINIDAQVFLFAKIDRRGALMHQHSYD